ncbi:hypothetical protein U9M48_040236 [Paspalum notatum var. saurae]|uniref:Cyclic nucleotide-binding domain-containing protein n=1 Tax=Paspalum notatum var. saurae TaxID=547442 RepID=A0AAQ3XFC7_PASNO
MYISLVKLQEFLSFEPCRSYHSNNGAGDKQQNRATGSARTSIGNNTLHKLIDCSRKWTGRQKWVLDPGGNIVLIWNRTFLVSCVASHCIDPLFFFLLVVDSEYLCMRTDHHLAIVLTCLRSLVDMFFIVHIGTRFCTAYVDPVSQVLGKGELVTDPKRIVYRYIRTNFFIDIVAALPVPQILVWAVMPNLSFSHISALMFLIILVQSAIRLYTIIQLSINIINTAGFINKNGWEGALYNLFLYLVASHVSLFIFPEIMLLSTYGNPLVTSSFIGENVFAIGLTLLSICLFAQLIGSMMICMRSLSTNAENWRIQKTEMEDWMTDHEIPDNLQNHISRFLEYKWITTQGIEEDSILRQLPNDLCRDIKRYLCLDLVQRVPLFSSMDSQLLDALCEHMTYFLRAEGTYIIHEGDPVKVMLFIVRGKLESSTTDGGRMHFFNSIILNPGDFCGEELLTWALLPSSADSYPSSTRTIKTITEFEAFSLQADDLKFVASAFRMLHSKHLQHLFRFYSHQWRTWAACLIQSAWRRHRNQQKMAERGLSSRWKSFFSLIDNHSSEARCENNDGSSSSLSLEAEFSISKIATIFTKLQKVQPEEPDFSMGCGPN